MKILNRSCWWCGHKLMAVSHAEVKTPDGKHTLWVHKMCAANTRGYFKPVTAQPDEFTTNFIQREYA